jgi:Concanavalin A-like lectin/glucanases superfamily
MMTSHLNRREWLKLAGGAGVAGMATSRVAVAAGRRSGAGPVANSSYANYVLSLKPVGYWRLGETNGPTALDWSGHENNGVYHGSPAFGEPGAIRNDANTAIGLDGKSYIEIPDQRAYSIGASGLTVQAWFRPDRLDFPCAPRAEYIHWLGKGQARSFEWGFRFYKKDSSRPNRISAYIWNPGGSEGAGAYVEEPVVAGKWINVVAVYQPPGKNAGVSLFRDGALKSGPPSPPTLYRSYQVTPRPGGAPVRLGCRDLTSFLRGGLDEVAIYPRCLTAAEILKGYRLATST